AQPEEVQELLNELLQDVQNISEELAEYTIVYYDDDDDEDYTIAITPDEVIKSSVEELVPIPSESEGISNGVCDVPLCDNLTPLKAFKDHYEIVVDSNDDSSLSDDDSFSSKNIKYVDASPPDSELLSLEVVENVTPEDGEIKDDILREKLLNINLLIAKIEALNANPTPSSDFVTKSPSTFPNSFLEETNTFDNSLTKSETFCFDLEENSSGSTTTLSDYSLLDYETFYDHIEEKSSGSTTTHSNFSLSKYDSFIFNMIRSSLIFRSIRVLLSIGVTVIMRSSPVNSLTSYLHRSMIVSTLRMSPIRAISRWM
ncbi:hypothetical protein Tco_0424283, partial [Tanacetum coccineum]